MLIVNYVNKVVVDQPVKKISAGSVENTLLLLDIVREKQHADNRKQKVNIYIHSFIHIS